MIKGVKKSMYFDTLAWVVTEQGCTLECTMKKKVVPDRPYPVLIFCVKITGPTGIVSDIELNHLDPNPLHQSQYYFFRGALHDAVFHYNTQCKQIGIK